MRLTAGLVLLTVVACSKTDPAPPPPSAAPGTARPATAPEAAPGPPVEVEERRGELVLEGRAAYQRVPFAIRAPKGWVPSGPSGEPPLDGSRGAVVFAAEEAGATGHAAPAGGGRSGADSSSIIISAMACPECTVERLHAAQQASVPAGAREPPGRRGARP